MQFFLYTPGKKTRELVFERLRQCGIHESDTFLDVKVIFYRREYDGVRLIKATWNEKIGTLGSGPKKKVGRVTQERWFAINRAPSSATQALREFSPGSELLTRVSALSPTMVKDAPKTAVAVKDVPTWAARTKVVSTGPKLIDAAINWWCSTRPVGWSLKRHLTQPTGLGGHTNESQSLAVAVAAHLRATHNFPKDVS